MKQKFKRVIFWDLPTRLFHWLLVLIFAGLWYTGKQGLLDWHFILGYSMFGLLLFRLFWGLMGSHTARFRQLKLHPKSAIDYLHGLGDQEILGHNPMGSWSVITMLFLLSIQVIAGLCANDAIMDEGPLAKYVSSSLSDQLTEIHKLNFNILLGIISLHVLVVLYYQTIKRQPLINAMLSGQKSIPEHIPTPPVESTLRAFLAIFLAALLAFAISTL